MSSSRIKGEVRGAASPFLLYYATCSVYQLYWWYLVGHELKSFLGKEDLNPTMDLTFMLLCPVYIFYMVLKYAKLVQEAQIVAGMPDAEDRGMTFLLWTFVPGAYMWKMQGELNKVWESSGGAPATF